MKTMNETAAEPLVSPLNEIVFQHVFGSRDNTAPLLSFLNAVLPDAEHAIEKVELLPTKELLPDDKLTCLDVKCILSDQTFRIVRIHVANDRDCNIVQRALGYWGSACETSLNRCNLICREMKAAAVISLLRFSLMPEEEDFHSVFGMQSLVHSERNFNKYMELHFLELPKYLGLERKPLADLTPEERWMEYFAGRLDQQEQEELARADAAIGSAMAAAKTFLQDEESRRLCLERQKVVDGFK